MTDNKTLLYESLRQYGIPLPPQGIKREGFTRYGKNKRYWIVRLRNGYAFGDFVSGLNRAVPNKTEGFSSKKELAKRKREVDKAYRELRAIQEKEWDKTATKAKEIYGQASLANVENVPYFKGRGNLIIPNALKLDRANLVVPYYNYKLELRTIQTVSPKGEKRFLLGGQKKGCFSFIGSLPNKESSPLIYIVEGFCTGASAYTTLHLHDVDVCVIVAGDAGNLKPVAIEIKMLYPNDPIVIAGDNDFLKEVNTGLIKAREASQAIGGLQL